MEALYEFVRVGSAYKKALCSKLKLDDKRAAKEKAAVAAHAPGALRDIQELEDGVCPPPSLAVPTPRANGETKIHAGFRNFALPPSRPPEPS